MAAMLVLEAIFEADMPSEQYAYRQNRNAHNAVREVHRLLVSGHNDVVDADLSGYYDTIPHVELPFAASSNCCCVAASGASVTGNSFTGGSRKAGPVRQ